MGQLKGESLHTFKSYSLNKFLIEKKYTSLNVLIGLKGSFAKWKLIHVETTYNGEEIVTLKAISSLGIIPEIDYYQIESNERENVRNRVNKLVDVVYSGSVESIVDRAGEACLSIILAFIRKYEPDVKGLTLHDALKKVGEVPELGRKKILFAACELLKLLHSRGKVSFQEKYGTRDLNESDSQAAIECFSIVVHELGIHSYE